MSMMEQLRKADYWRIVGIPQYLYILAALYFLHDPTKGPLAVPDVVKDITLSWVETRDPIIVIYPFAGFTSIMDHTGVRLH